MKILLAIDDSKFSEAATQVALRELRPDRTEVCVLNVVEPILAPPYEYIGDVETLNAEQQKTLKHGKEMVGRTQQLLERAGFKVHPVVEEGDPKSTIIDYASHWKADLIIVGSHGRRGLDRFLMGSVAEAVARHAPCSVLISRRSFGAAAEH